jgi:hypothetical protein
VNITLEYKYPSYPSSTHCKIAVFVNGDLTGELTLRQEDLASFDMILHHGGGKMDTILSRGDPGPWTSPRA